MHYERDPLLPRDEPAPEIHGSKPQSVNNVEDSDARECANSMPGQSRNRGSGIIATFTGLLTVVLIVLLLFPDGPWRIGPGGNSKRQTINDRVTSILKMTPLIDGHNDLAIFIRYLYDNHIYDNSFTEPFTGGGFPSHVDLPRLKEGRVGGAFWAAFAPCPANGMDFSDENYKSSVSFTYNQIDLLKRLQSQYPTHFAPPSNSSTALLSFRNGHMISPLAIEGLHQIGNSLSNLRNYFELGARYATLTHNCHNKYADAALLEAPGGVIKAKPYWGGVSPAGQTLIREMNRLGMMVDLSHVSYDTMRDVLGGANNSWSGSAAPPIFSHSSAYAICPHPRNVPDDILQLVKQRDSIVMVNFSPDFISCISSNHENGMPDFYPKNATLGHVVEHIMYIGQLIGYDHVGLGSDFDGIRTVPEGLDDVSKFPDLVAEMLRRGVSDGDAAKVVGKNILRVWKDVDTVALRLQAAGEVPLEDDLPSLRLEDTITL